MMKTSSIEGDSPPGQDKGDMIHPILGNYYLPVEIEDAKKPSGLHNLSREGWSEDKCRNYLVRICSDVPRNLPFKDGVRILHPRLQERFGDENVDLALGVLEELIEVEEPPPFPASIYQRWKHDYLRRKEDFENPHVPHTTTIQAPVIPTKKLIKYREEQALKQNTQPRIIPSALPYCESCNSKIAHQPSWKIEHSVFVSTGGRPATVAYCPTPKELHEAMWDPQHGRGGVCVRPSTAQTQTSAPSSTIEPAAPNASSSKYSTPTRSFMNNAKRELAQRVMSALSETRESPNDLASDRVELLSIKGCEKPRKNMESAVPEALEKIDEQGAIRNVSKIMNVSLPPGRQIPNVNFARKNEILHSGEITPDYLLVLRQPTVDETVKGWWGPEAEAAANFHDPNPLRSRLARNFSLPPSPEIFYDGGLDYKWEFISNDDNTEPSVEILHPTVYAPPAKNNMSKKENRTERSALRSETSLEEHEHQGRHSYDGTCQSWECRFKEELRKSTGNLVKWTEPSSEYDEESEVSEASRLSPTVNSPPFVSDRLSERQRFPRSDQPPSLKGDDSSFPLKVKSSGGFTSHSNEAATDQTPKADADNDLEGPVNQLLKSHISTPLGEANFTPPGRLFERSYLSKIPIRKESLAAFNIKKAGSPEDSIPLATEFPFTSQSKTNGNQHTDKNEHLTISCSLEFSDESPLPVIASQPVQKGVMNFDGASDVYSSKQNNKTKQATRDNSPQNFHNSPKDHNENSLYDENHIGEAAKRFLMELNQGRLPTLQSPIICPPQPLYISKQPSRVQLEESTKHQNNNTSNEQTRFPPRSSSIPKPECLNPIEQATPFFIDQETAMSKPNTQFGISKVSNNCGSKVSHISSDLPNTPETTARSTVSDIKQYYFSGNSGGLFGDFIPIGTPGSVYSPQQQQPAQTMSANSSSYGRKAENFKNPYAFEPETPEVVGESRQTTMTDFMHIYDDIRPASSPSLGHVKNSRSVGHGTNRSDFLTAPESSSHGYGLQRRGTSPSVVPLRFAAREESPNSDNRAHYADIDSISPILHNAYPTQNLPHRGRAATIEPSPITGRKGLQELCPQPSSSPVRQATRGVVQLSRSPVRKPSGDRMPHPQSTDEEFLDGRGRSATYAPARKQTNSGFSNESYSSSASTTINRQKTRSPTKNLVGVTEQDEPNNENPDFPLLSPKKRSRSPMKRMFGENGWLGSSPNEVIPSIPSSKSAQKIDKPKKTGMMEKIKSKIEGFSEKADLRADKNRISVLSISVNPYEQARYLVELELMIVHTANTFLMIQFSQGRMSIDSIKKTVDTWKNKGRPAVVEFMYDQGTQRDLVTANQYNFRFHGDRLGDDVRISSMLYNWKQVASLMSIRTFCNADTVLLKLVFDIEQILELIGGSQQIMLRLQHLRLSINEAIRLAKVERNIQTSQNGQEKEWAPNSSSNISPGDPYGGMKLVPEHYAD